MDNKQQTGGQLSVKERDEGGFTILDGNGGLIAICSTWSLFDTRELAIERAKQNQANANRLVACWNACEDISTEDIEKRGVCTRFDAALQFKDTGNLIVGEPAAVQQVSDLMAQRDQLLAALELAKSHIGWCWDHIEHLTRLQRDGSAEVHSQIDAAIAKAKGGAQ